MLSPPFCHYITSILFEEEDGRDRAIGFGDDPDLSFQVIRADIGCEDAVAMDKRFFVKLLIFQTQVAPIASEIVPDAFEDELLEVK